MQGGHRPRVFVCSKMAFFFFPAKERKRKGKDLSSPRHRCTRGLCHYCSASEPSAPRGSGLRAAGEDAPRAGGPRAHPFSSPSGEKRTRRPSTGSSAAPSLWAAAAFVGPERSPGTAASPRPAPQSSPRARLAGGPRRRGPAVTCPRRNAAPCWPRATRARGIRCALNHGFARKRVRLRFQTPDGVTLAWPFRTRLGSPTCGLRCAEAPFASRAQPLLASPLLVTLCNSLNISSFLKQTANLPDRTVLPRCHRARSWFEGRGRTPGRTGVREKPPPPRGCLGSATADEPGPGPARTGLSTCGPAKELDAQLRRARAASCSRARRVALGRGGCRRAARGRERHAHSGRSAG